MCSTNVFAVKFRSVAHLSYAASSVGWSARRSRCKLLGATLRNPYAAFPNPIRYRARGTAINVLIDKGFQHVLAAVVATALTFHGAADAIPGSATIATEAGSAWSPVAKAALIAFAVGLTGFAFVALVSLLTSWFGPFKRRREERTPSSVETSVAAALQAAHREAEEIRVSALEDATRIVRQAQAYLVNVDEVIGRLEQVRSKTDEWGGDVRGAAEPYGSYRSSLTDTPARPSLRAADESVSSIEVQIQMTLAALLDATLDLTSVVAAWQEERAAESLADDLRDRPAHGASQTRQDPA